MAEERSGTGLGLAIVRAIAEAHGGTVGIESTVGRGTCVQLRLPVSGSAAQRVEDTTSRASEHPS